MSAATQVFSSLAAVRLPAQPLHLAIGIFDGVHLGHQAVVGAALHSARREGGLAGVLTFDPHPSRLFRPENPVRLLMPVGTKTCFLREKLGADFVVQEPFTPAFAAMPAESFLPHLKAALPLLHAVYVGENWRYGAGRRGDVPVLCGRDMSRACVFSVLRASISTVNRSAAPGFAACSPPVRSRR